MLYALINADGTFAGMTSDAATARVHVTKGGHHESRWDWEDITVAEDIAKQATEFHGVLYIATDAGEWVLPRYDVQRAPSVGDEVSYSFNGDTYPDGTIAAISPTLKTITTSSGRRYYRKRNTGSWLYSGTWSLVSGHRQERNPHI